MTRWLNNPQYVLDGKEVLPYRDVFQKDRRILRKTTLQNKNIDLDDLSYRIYGDEFFNYRIVDLNIRSFLENGGILPPNIYIE